MSITVTTWQRQDGEPPLGALRRRLESEGMATAWCSEVPGVVFAEHGHAFDIPARTPHRAQVPGLSPVIDVTGAPADAFPRPARPAVSAA